MYNNYRIVVNTAAGRRRYMQYLIPFVISSEIVDRYDIWVNTHNGADIEFFKRIAEKYSKVNLVWQPDGVVAGISSINAFYRKCVEENTIYFKLDDDIVWMEPNAIENMVRFRIDNREYFLVSPLIINNALSTYLLQVRKKIKLDKYYNSMSAHPVLWNSGEFATQLHEWFLNTQLPFDAYKGLHIGKQPMAMTRFSINCILWFGDEMKKFDGQVTGDDEEFLSCIYPTEKGMSNCWNGDVVMSHFAFFPQRNKLDNANILSLYGEYLSKKWKEDALLDSINQEIQEIMCYVTANEEKLTAVPSPYKKVELRKRSFAMRLYEYLLRLFRHKNGKNKAHVFIAG